MSKFIWLAIPILVCQGAKVLIQDIDDYEDNDLQQPSLAIQVSNDNITESQESIQQLENQSNEGNSKDETSLTSVESVSESQQQTNSDSKIDQSSLSNFQDVQSEHLSFNLQVSFQDKKLSGFVDISMRSLKPALKQVVLDSSRINVQKVILISKSNKEQKFSFNQQQGELGQGLVIDLDQEQGLNQLFVLRIFYKTGDGAEALQWLDENETKGGKLPYMFTQCQPIACRSLAPMQDTLAFKITYDAKISVQSDMTVFMSAVSQSSEVVDNNMKTYSFVQEKKVPTYLIAMAVGDITKEQAGSRVSVISEPSEIKKDMYNLRDMQKYLDATEKYLTPYAWQEFTILMLPGLMTSEVAGMENPYLTIVSSSHSNMVLHELAHSWFGNQVTCQSWPEFWMNEAFAVFIERKITKQLLGKQETDQEIKQGNDLLTQDVNQMGSRAQSDSALQPMITPGQNPEKSQSQVQYEKGFQFLQYLENIVGEQPFQEFLRQYIGQYSFKSVQSQDFISAYKQQFQANKEIEKVDWQKWIYSPGMPPIQL